MRLMGAPYIFIVAVFCSSLLADTKSDILQDATLRISKRYTSELPTLKILNIDIKPQQNVDFEGLRLFDIELANKSGFLRKEGTVVLLLSGVNSTQKKLFARYRVEGFLGVVKAGVNIPKDTILTLDNVKFDSVKFDWLQMPPVQNEQLGSVVAKRLLPTGTIITKKDVGPIALVKKFSAVTAVISSDAMELTFEATAQEDGVAGQIISIKNKQGKIFKARILSAARVSVE